jgi:catechol 2,3-dioxygenase
MQLNSVSLTVRDLERSVGFYTTAIGLELLKHGDATVALGLAGHERLTLVERPDAAPRDNAAGLFHIAWLLASRAHLGAALGRLAAAGVRLTGAADHHVSEAVYLDDPDGHGIELYADRPAATWRRDGAVVVVNERLDLDDLVEVARRTGLAPEASTEGASLGHLHLEAIDLSAAKSFAQASLGLELQADWPHAAFLAWNGYHHHLAYNDWRGRSRPLDPDENHIGLLRVGLVGDGPGRTLTDPNGVPIVIA